MRLNDGVLEVKVKIKGRLYVYDLYEELKITESTMRIDITKQAAKFAWFAVLCSTAESFASRCELEKRTMYAKLYKKHRRLMEASDEKVTEGRIESEVRTDKKYLEASNKLIDAITNAELLKGAVSAFRQRKDMLMIMSGNLRAEMSALQQGRKV